MKDKFIGLFFCFFFLFVSGVKGQQKFFRSWSVKDGLPQSLVYTITQDSAGFLWVGTYGGGLAKFDGNKFKVFDKEDGLPSDRIRVIKTDPSGNLWVGTDGGLVVIDREVAREIKIPGTPHPVIRNICFTKNKTWIATQRNGIYLLDANLDLQKIKFPKDPDLAVKEMFFYEGFMYAGAKTSGKDVIFRIDEETRAVAPVHFPDSNSFQLLSIDRQGNFWLKGGDDYIAVYNLHSNAFEVGNMFRIKSKIITALYDSQGIMWIGTEGEGLIRVEGEKATYYTEKEGLLSGIITEIYEDNSGAIWAGTEGGGFSRFTPSPFSFYTAENGLSDNKVMAITEDNKGNIWLGTLGNGISIFKEGKFMSNITGAPSFIMSMEIDSKGNIWAGTINEGVYQFRGTHLNKVYRSDGLTENRIMDILEAGDGAVWMAKSDGGVSRLKNGRITNYTVEDGLISNKAFALEEDSSGNIWIGTKDRGISVFNGESFENFGKHNGLPSENILSLTRNGELLIIGTNGGGLICRYGEHFYQFSKKDGLQSDNIYQLSVDNNNYVWVGSEKGIEKLKLGKRKKTDQLYIEELVNFGLKGRLLGAESCLQAAYKDNNGDLWFGTIEGLIRYKSGEADNKITTPLIKITGFRVFQEAMKKEGRSSFLGELPDMPQLKYNYNHITIDFTGIAFSTPENVRYRYRLHPLENNWSPVNRESHATYSSLPSGKYVFKVISSIDGKEWNRAPAEYAFRIAPPFWRTWWFSLLGTVFFIAAVVGIIKIRTYAIRKREEKLKEIVHQRTKALLKKNEELLKAKDLAEKAKRSEEQFLANVSHEMRTPMNAIIGLANLLLDAEMPNKSKKYIESIKFSADNLMIIINDILDISRMDEGLLTFNKKDFSIRKQVNRLVQALSIKSGEKQLDLRCNIDENIPEKIHGDPVRLNQVLLNLLDNAIKFTEKGWVAIDVNCDEENDSGIWLEFRISDTGIGIPQEQQKMIFERFRRIESEQKISGAGLGLAITKKIIELKGGQISIESELGKGAVFTVKIPYEKAADSGKKAKKQHLSAAKEPDSIPSVNHQIKILIAEDNELNRIVVEGFLKKMELNNFEVAVNGKEALEKHQKNNYDLILMDIKMPEMNGFEAAKKIRKLPQPQCDTPIIAVTAYYSQKDIAKVKAAGMNDYITKPFEPEVFFEKIKSYFESGEKAEIFANGDVAAANNAVIDLSLLEKMGGRESSAFKAIIRLFIEKTPADINNLRTSYQKKDWLTFGKTVHNLKSNVQYIGIKELTAEIKDMGEAAKKEVALEEIPGKIDKVEEICKKAIGELEIELKGE